jgi:hypothetical protein
LPFDCGLDQCYPLNPIRNREEVDNTDHRIEFLPKDRHYLPVESGVMETSHCHSVLC